MDRAVSSHHVDSDRPCRLYHKLNQADQRKQRLKWAATGRTSKSREVFKLLSRPVCSGAMAIITGISKQTWTATLEEKENELHAEKPHGNTVSILYFCKHYTGVDSAVPLLVFESP